MFEIKDKAQDVLVVTSTLLWVFIVIASCIGSSFLGYLGLIAGCVLVGIYFILGATVKGKIGIKVPLLYPLLIMFVLWVAGFTIAYLTRGIKTESWILGLHPGQFWSILLVWIGGGLTLILGYALYCDKYLFPEDAWEDFLKEVEKNKSNMGSEDE